MNSASSQSRSTTERRLAASPSFIASLAPATRNPSGTATAGPGPPACRPAPPGVPPLPRSWRASATSLRRSSMIARASGWRNSRAGSTICERRALAALADRVDRLQAQHHRQAGERVRGQVLIGAGRELGRLVAGLEQRQPLDLGLRARPGQQQRQLGHAIVVRGLEIDPAARCGGSRAARRRSSTVGAASGTTSIGQLAISCHRAVGHRQRWRRDRASAAPRRCRAQGLERRSCLAEDEPRPSPPAGEMVRLHPGLAAGRHRQLG